MRAFSRGYHVRRKTGETGYIGTTTINAGSMFSLILVMRALIHVHVHIHVHRRQLFCLTKSIIPVTNGRQGHATE